MNSDKEDFRSSSKVTLWLIIGIVIILLGACGLGLYMVYGGEEAINNLAELKNAVHYRLMRNV